MSEALATPRPRPADMDALRAAVEIGERLADPEEARAAFVVAQRQLRHIGVGAARPLGLAQGHAGLAVMFGTLYALDGGDWDVVAHAHLAAAAQGLAAGPMRLGMFDGLAGLGLAAHSVAGALPRYERLLASVDAELVRIVPAMAARVAKSDGLAVSDFDVISGLSGIGAYLLIRRRDTGARSALRSLLAALATLCAAHRRPRWRTPPERMTDVLMLKRYPRGNSNCGCAHGVAGPLAVLSRAWRDGERVAGMDAAIRSTSQWLVENRLEDEFGPNWPNVVPPPGETRGGELVASRPTWCYGAPGVARAIWEAGAATSDGALIMLARRALQATHDRMVAGYGPESPTLCHGRAGVALATARLADDLGDPQLREAARSWAGALVSEYDTNAAFGWRTVHRGGARIDQPGFLDGASGVATALLTLLAGAPAAWSRAFLMA